MEALLDTVAAVKALLERGRKLLRKFLPGPLSNLSLKSMKDLGEDLLEVRLRVNPASDSIAEEDEVRDNTAWVHADHLTHPAESRVLLVIVPDVPE